MSDYSTVEFIVVDNFTSLLLKLKINQYKGNQLKSLVNSIANKHFRLARFHKYVRN